MAVKRAVKIDTRALNKLCLRIADLKTQKAEADRLSNQCGVELEKLYDTATDKILETGQKKWYLQGAGTFVPVFKQSYTIVNQERLKDWLTKHGLTSLIRLHPQVITEWAGTELKKLEEKNKAYLDADKLNEYALRTFGFTFYERKSIRFNDKEGRYKGAEEE